MYTANIIQLCEKYSSICPLVDSRYRLIKSVGESRFGRVYLCLDTKISKIIALKELKKIDSNNESLRMFLNEIRNLSKLNTFELRKYVCPLLDFNFDGQYDTGHHISYYTMEYKAMGDLYSLIDSCSHYLPEKLAGHFYLQLQKALEKIHEQGIAHLDIKPENIVLDEKLNLFICDFGHSFNVKNTSLLLRTQNNKNLLKKRINFLSKISFIGSEIYSSPEINNFQDNFDLLIDDPNKFMNRLEEIDFYKSDIFSAGITFFVIFFKAIPPFKKSQYFNKDLFNKQFWEDCLEIRNFSEDFKNLFTNSSKFNPKERYDVQEILDDIFFDENQFYDQYRVVEEMEEWIFQSKNKFLKDLEFHLEEVYQKNIQNLRTKEINKFIDLKNKKIISDFISKHKKEIQWITDFINDQNCSSSLNSSSSFEDFTFN